MERKYMYMKNFYELIDENFEEIDKWLKENAKGKVVSSTALQLKFKIPQARFYLVLAKLRQAGYPYHKGKLTIPS